MCYFSVPVPASDVIITFTELRDCETNAIQLSEIKFYDVDANELRPLDIANPWGNTPEMEGPENLIDGNVNTKWLDFSAVLEGDCSTTSLSITFSNKPVQMTITTANDHSERDPISLTITVCATGDTNCINVIHNDISAPTERFADYPPISLTGEQ